MTLYHFAKVKCLSKIFPWFIHHHKGIFTDASFYPKAIVKLENSIHLVSTAREVNLPSHLDQVSYVKVNNLKWVHHLILGCSLITPAMILSENKYRTNFLTGDSFSHAFSWCVMVFTGL